MSQPQTFAIVLGAAVLPGGRPSPALRRRAEHAARLYREGKIQHIVASGWAEGDLPSQALVIRGICVENGVPGDAVTLEGKSRNTLENIKNSLALIPGDVTPIIVSDCFHTPRARLVMFRLGRRASASSPSLRGAPPGKVLRAVLRELPALAYYLLRAL